MLICSHKCIVNQRRCLVLKLTSFERLNLVVHLYECRRLKNSSLHSDKVRRVLGLPYQDPAASTQARHPPASPRTQNFLCSKHMWTIMALFEMCAPSTEGRSMKSHIAPHRTIPPRRRPSPPTMHLQFSWLTFSISMHGHRLQ